MKLNKLIIGVALLFYIAISCQDKHVRHCDKTVFLNGSTKTGTDNDSIPFVNIKYSKNKTSKGTVLFFQGKETGEKSDSFIVSLNNMGFDVASLKGTQPTTSDGAKALRLIKTDTKLNLQNGHICFAGIADGAKHAVRTIKMLSKENQPDDMIIINPKGFEETIPGTVFPDINPPLTIKTKLLCVVDTLLQSKKTIRSCNEYVKTWIGYDGKAFFRENSDDIGLQELLNNFLLGEMAWPCEKENPAAIPVEGYHPERHAKKIKLVKNHKYDLIFVGNSITHNFEKPQYQPVWNKYFAPRNALNLGYSGYRTENIIWNIQNGELEGQSPKVIVLGIGTNNIDEKNYPTRHTAVQLAGGIKEIVKELKNKCPDSKIILLRCFPGCYGGPNPTSHRRILERTSEIISRLADGKSIFYCDVNHVFLNMDGSINHKMLGDWLHPTPAGAKAWAQAMEPLLSKLMGDDSRDNEKPANSAIIPEVNHENNSYHWMGRHNDVLRVKDSLNPEIVLIGNSITHLWGGKYPPFKNADGTLRKPNGAEAWKKTFGGHRVLNLGFGWDRTQNVLWRLDNGELDGLHPKLAIIHIGTNNTSDTKNARANTAPEIAEGIKAICLRIRSKVPETKIILMAIMPREEKPNNPRRTLINETNKILKTFAKENDITVLDIGSKMLTSKGILTKEITLDYCHLTAKGYQIWGDALHPFIEEIECR